MTLGEFKAWLDGYECSFNTMQVAGDPGYPVAVGMAPDAEQWAEIKRRLDQVTLVQVPAKPAQAGQVAIPPSYERLVRNAAGVQADIINPLAAGSYVGLQSNPYKTGD